MFRKIIVLATATEAAVEQLDVYNNAGMSEIESHARKGNNAKAFDTFRLQESSLRIWICGDVNRLKILLRSQRVRMFEWQIRRKRPVSEILNPKVGVSTDGRCKLFPMKG